MKTLYIIDGHAQFFRAFHAIRSAMTSPVTKEPTNATFGFVGLILKLLKEDRPDYLVTVIDVSGDRETFRSEIYPEYKAHREKPPESFGPQVERCVSLLEAVGVPVLGEAGVEADDVIATLVERHKGDADLKIRIISKDKDLQQLLEPGRVEMYDAHTGEVIDVDRLLEKKGVAPSQVVDMLALMGDTVDNVPGVPGVGEKTAAKLIGEYGSLDALMARADEIKGKRGEALRAAKDLLPLSRTLVTLKRDVDVELDFDRAKVAGFDLPALAPILQQLGFNRYQEELKSLLGERGETVADAPAETPAAPEGFGSRAGGGFDEEGGLFAGLSEGEPAARRAAQGEYRCVRTKRELDALVKELRAAPIIAVDTETTGLDPMRAALCGLSFATEPGAGAYVPVRSPEPESHLDAKTVLAALKPVLEDPARPKTGHNLKYDMLVLRRAGVELRGVAFDGMVASYLVDPSRSSHAMDPLALALLGRTTISITELIGTGKKQKTFDTVPLEQAAEYAAEDADVSLQLCRVLEKPIDEMGLRSLMDEVETPLVEVLAELQWNGIEVDAAELDRQAERLQARITELRAEVLEEAGRDFNPDSPKQLAEVLFNKPEAETPGLGVKPRKKTKTGYSTDVEVLEALAADPDVTTRIPELILEHRSLTKLVGTYLVALKEAIHPETGRIHASFNQTVAATGRLSSSDPNLQNIPIRTEVGREIRRAFVAPAGRVLIGADYSQIELRLLAHLSQDDALIKAFQAGEDIHRAVAAQIHGVKPSAVTDEQRSGAKMVNFGIVYGVTPFGLARRLGIGNDDAAAIIDGYKRRFAGISTFLAECVAKAEADGYVETMLGRRRPIPQIASRHPNERSLGERMAINSVVQGSAADLIKLAMVDLHVRLSEHAGHLRKAKGMKEKPEIAGVRMLLQIHDELVFEAPREQAEETLALVKSRMEGAMDLLVPLVVEARASLDWFEGK
ncbi:MAG: DNA polymerase I [Phycisphaerales bacterium]